MYERMLTKDVAPTKKDMADYCGTNSGNFLQINDWLTDRFHTEQHVTFPYGNKYGWCIGHYIRKKLICNIFPENGAFTVMLRLTNQQCDEIYDSMNGYTKDYIDNKYPCSNGGWIHYRVAEQGHYEDLVKFLEMKCNGN